MNKTFLIGAVIVLLGISAWYVFESQEYHEGSVEETYSPTINPDEFTNIIDNPYFALPVGKKMVYEAETEEGTERIEILIPGWTKEVMGIETLVYWDRVFLDGVLIEDTRDYLAQHANGDVWYFGEDVDNYEDGELADHDGAWLAGEDGALPGIWLKADSQVGDSYYQEYYAGEAEDRGDVTAIGQSVDVAYGTVTDCVVVFEYSALFPETANKYHCQSIGGTALEVDLVSGDQTTEQRTELIEIEQDGALGMEPPKTYQAEGVMPRESE